jgi:hypothetical protein
MYIYLPLCGDVRKVDELGLENVAEFQSDHVTIRYGILDTQADWQGKKRAANRFLTYCVNKEKSHLSGQRLRRE